MLTSKQDVVLHRTGITAADSGIDPSAWADAPDAFMDMASGQVLRIYPQVNSGTVTELGIQILTIVNSSLTCVSTETLQTGTFTSATGMETMEFVEGYEAEAKLYIKISTLSGTTPNVSLYVSAVNNK